MYLNLDLDSLDKVARIVGFPSITALLIWIVRSWESQRRDTKEMHTFAKATHELVQTMNGNHLAHLQTDMTQVVQTNSKAVDLLTSMDKNMAIQTALLQERSGRRRI